MLNFLIAWLHNCIIIYGWWNPNIWSNLQRCNSEPSRGGKFPQFLTWSSDFTVSTVNLKSKLKKMCTGYFVVLIIFSEPVVIGEFSPAGAAEVAEAACARYARTEGGLWKWRLQDSGLGMKMWKHIFIAQHYTRTCYLFLSLHCIAEQQKRIVYLHQSAPPPPGPRWGWQEQDWCDRPPQQGEVWIVKGYLHQKQRSLYVACAGFLWNCSCCES